MSLDGQGNTRNAGQGDMFSSSFNGQLGSNDSSERPSGWISRRLSPRSLELWEEVMLQLHLAAPIVTVSLLQLAFQFIAMIVVGHLGKLALASSSIATSLANVTGTCVMLGMASTLETFCGQAFGAKQYRQLGIFLITGLIVFNTLAIFLSFIYFYMGEILLVLGQDQLIAREAGKYAKYLIPSLFALASSQAIIKYLQTQSLVYPMVLCSGIAAAIHLPLCWFLVYKTSFGFTGAALSTSICLLINAILLAAYVMFSPSCSKTRPRYSRQVFHGMGGFLKLAISSAGMTCLEWWCYEILVLLAGLLPNPQLQTSTLSVCLNLASVIFQIPFGLGATASTRIANELGAGNPRAAHNAVLVGMVLTESQACMVSIVILCFRNVLGHVFSNEPEVIKSVASLLPLLAISSFLDSTQGVLSGIARGCRWQSLGAIINLGSFYVVALPIGACLGFLTSLQARGFWIGAICGPFVQVVLLGALTWAANWEAEVLMAQRHIEAASSTTPLLVH